MFLQKILNSRPLTIFFVPFILGLITVFSFQPFNFIFVNFLIFPGLFLIISYVKKKSQNIYRKKPYLINLFFVGYSFGVGFFLSNTYWISNSLTFDETFKYLIPFAIILIPSFLGLFYGIGILLVGQLIKNNFTSILVFTASLSFVDYLRSKILTGFPWNLWAYSWSSFTEILQILNVVGLFAFNLLCLTIFCLPLLLIFNANKNFNKIIFSTFILIFFSNYLYGNYKINKNDVLISKENSFVNIKVISPRFDLKYNLSIDDVGNLTKKLIKYSEPKIQKKTIFIWPEGVFTGFSFSEVALYKDLFINNFSENHLIIFGINIKDEVSNNYYNSLVVVNNKFDIIYRYNKIKLVPFGEVIPFKNYLSKVGLKKVTEGYGSFLSGKKQKNFIFENLNILPLICYEVIFPQLTQQIQHDTNLIINISEDAWFGGSIGPEQHFAKAIYRAIESNTFLVRAANQGYSAIIDNSGRIIKSLKPNEIGNIELKVPLINNSNKNRNDLIFFVLLFTYIIIFFTLKNKLK
jgi:apolipoprotein N-acyltransferase